ncbi:hypothetical protein QYE76_069554 [Lolium multiflorum]|uniref:Uncharacterized protein n=1 Tax=Lolium multiflorum TaxID=4521 RepID=A0AAD8SH06_LOLMU|nr:hypothetical protein QYE76_069554 [Lolium multiflorum]
MAAKAARAGARRHQAWPSQAWRPPPHLALHHAQGRRLDEGPRPLQRAAAADANDLAHWSDDGERTATPATDRRGPSDCLNHLEEDYDNNDGAEIIGYEEPDLSGGVEGVDYIIVYGSGEASGGEQA